MTAVSSLIIECTAPLAGFIGTRFVGKTYNSLFVAYLGTYALYRTAYHFYPPVKSWTQQQLQDSNRARLIVLGSAISGLAGLYFSPKSEYAGYFFGGCFGILTAMKIPEPKED